MTLPSQPLPSIDEPNSTADPKVRAALDELQDILSGNIDLTNIATSLLHMATAGDRKVNAGTGVTPSFGGTPGVNGSFAHGLGVTPMFWAATFQQITVGGIGRIVVAADNGRDTTTIYYTARTIDESNLPAAINFVWLAIG